MSCLCLLLLPLQLLKHSLELLLLLLGLLNGRLVLLVVSHGHHGQDQVHQVKRAQEDHQHKEDHVGFSCCTQSLMGKKQEFQVGKNGMVCFHITTVMRNSAFSHCHPTVPSAAAVQKEKS